MSAAESTDRLVGLSPVLCRVKAWGNQKPVAFYPSLPGFVTGLDQEGSPGCWCAVHTFLHYFLFVYVCCFLVSK